MAAKKSTPKAVKAKEYWTHARLLMAAEACHRAVRVMEKVVEGKAIQPWEHYYIKKSKPSLNKAAQMFSSAAQRRSDG
jgi:hypothetical protein